MCSPCKLYRLEVSGVSIQREYLKKAEYEDDDEDE